MAKSPVKTSGTSRTTVSKEPVNTSAFAFGRENYILMIASVVVVIIGFILMSGGKSPDPNVFSEDIFSFRRITLAPIVVIAGYVLGVYAIVKKAA